ncbi:transposase [Candidatus Mycobacterium methanotrophicum]|uniref:Transposase n=1 Tax=Candidatus Mycobacterium methanotrophicum TaxID=2943498 RepID=A0ABY4QF52_9MYCO|nr:transposase [Candidatus Mycobacterium methanotrophicum]UQX09553.1 transposase [Candidatus Mycobacterium methanotrophicum]UQX11671.1 transposase [Candidatus Mycobacterium methanotrophicum]
MWRTTVDFCEGRVAPDSIYGVLHRECLSLFGDEMFADMFTDVGRRSVPPTIVAVVMVLQRIEGLSDREAVQRFAFDARWKYAAGGLDFDYPGFVHTVLVDMRARLARSDRPDRIFEVTLQAAKAAGLAGRKRALDSTPLYDAVATMDTVTLIRSAIRGLLAVAGAELRARLRARLSRDDDYARAGKPVCDYDDAEAREELVDALARHGHKTSARGFDGYKGHIAIDPGAEIITAAEVTAGSAGDAEPATDLLAGDLPAPPTGDTNTADGDCVDSQDDSSLGRSAGTTTAAGAAGHAHGDGDGDGSAPSVRGAQDQPGPAVYGDAAYGAGKLLAVLETAGADIVAKVQPPTAPGGRYAKDRFAIDLAAGTVTCPGAVAVPIRPATAGGGTAVFGPACASCPLAAQCTSSTAGRTIAISRYEAELTRARTAQADPAWVANYKATRPKVERKIGHLMRRRHGGRRARMRGTTKAAADFSLLAAAINLARLGVLGIHREGANWAAAAT